MGVFMWDFICDEGKGGVGPVNEWDKGECGTRIKGKGVMREGSPLINLGLGISAGLGVNVSQQGKFVFTDKQLNELHQQALIHNYFVAGLSVPFHLVLPIWKSVVSSFGSGNARICNHYPSIIGLCPQGFDYRSMMDPEPQRCRRTDGKKWRCSRNVIPDQKYCERHMHRGRQRSRKHVEASQNILEYDTTTTAKIIRPNNTTPATISDNAYKNTRNTAKTVTTSFANGMIRSNKNMYANNDPYARPPTIPTYNSNNVSTDNVNLSLDTICTTTATTSNAVATDNNSSSSKNRYSCTDGRDDGFIYIDDRHNISRSNCKIGNFVSPGFGFSPKSVLQGGTVVGCSSLAFGYGTLLEAEPQRCRRTDGKKWRCSQDVIPEQKYCARHMHRGVKKVIVPSMAVAVAAAPPPPPPPPPPPLVTVAKKVNDYVNLNTDLSISIASSPQHKGDNDESSTSASCSDATTITDENMGVSHNLALSP